jgi:hypothetical protein
MTAINLNTKQEKFNFLKKHKEDIKQLLDYEYADILADYESISEYFGNSDPDVILYKFVLDNFIVLYAMFI